MTHLMAAYMVMAVSEPADGLRDEDDFIAEQQRGSLSDASLDAWLEVLREGIDLRTTTREELGNVPGLTPADIETILSVRETEHPLQALNPTLRERLSPFLRSELGRARLVSQVTTTDSLAPPVLLEARAYGPFSLNAGVLLDTTRRSVDTPRIVEGTLQTRGFGYHLQVPRFSLQWQHATLRLIVGTFTVGFAERLTLDTTRRLSPQGFALGDDFRHPVDLSRTCRLSSLDVQAPCEEGRNVYLTPDFTVREVFRGVAASIERVALGDQRELSAFGFLSYQARSVYQYELLDRRACADPSLGCAAPPVYVEGTNTRLIFSTLPALYDELTGGAHAQLTFSDRLQFGATGYAAAPFFHDLAPLDLSFQPWSRHPATGPFGAIGIDAQARLEAFAFHFEATRTFDETPGNGGGFGVIERTTYRTFELSLRYYDNHFANPNARPVSAPDEYDGQRARNELGARLTASVTLAPRWVLTGRADFWVLPFSNPRVGPAGMANLYALARVDFAATERVHPGLWVETRNRNLASSVHGRCASGTVIYTEGEPFDCSGDLYRVATRLEVEPSHHSSLIAQSMLTLTDDPKYPDGVRVDFQQWLEGRGQPAEGLQWRARLRYLNQAVDDNAYLEHSLWSFIELAWLPLSNARIAVRYDLYVWLDTRAVTLTRVPNPEHRFTLDVRTTF